MGGNRGGPVIHYIKMVFSYNIFYIYKVPKANLKPGEVKYGYNEK